MYTNAILRKQERGMALALALVIGSLMLVIVFSLASGVYTMFKRANFERGAMENSAYAHELYGCVRNWLNQNPLYFTNDPDVLEGATYTVTTCIDEEDPTTCSTQTYTRTNPACRGVEFDFHNSTQTAADGAYVSDGVYGTSTMLIDNIRVEVVRDLTRPTDQFDGLIYIYARTDPQDGLYVAERFHKYRYKVGVAGVDIMLVLDRSGSINGDRFPNPETGEWLAMRTAVADVVTEFGSDALMNIRFGLVTFGTSVRETENQLVLPSCPTLNYCVVIPENPLNADYLTIADNGGSYNDPLGDSFGNMSVVDGYTNISQGITVGALALLDRYYPAGPTSFQTQYTAAGTDSTGGVPGWFEQKLKDATDSVYTTHGTFSFLDPVVGEDVRQDMKTEMDSIIADMWPITVDANHGDRNDANYPDYVFLITDGDPNRVVQAANSTLTSGGTILALGSGANTASCIRSISSNGVITPALLWPGYEEDYGDWREAKCNATITKRAFNALGIRFGVIGVGVSQENATWLSREMSDLPYVGVSDYSQLRQALVQLFGGVALLELR